MRPTKLRVARILVGFGAAVFLGIAAAWGQTYSHARIVRLSFVEGTVTVQRPDVADWAEAPMNTPLQEGFKLSTAERSFAEVEFENGSTLRLGQLSMLEFTQLALAPDGSKISRLTMDKGYATFHAVPEGQDVYEVLTPIGTITPRGKALFRVDADSSAERVEVFNGSLEVASSLGSWTLAKNSVLELRPGTAQPDQLSEGITKDDWDRWVLDRESREEVATNGPSPSAYSNDVNGVFYGWSDLSYDGNWSYMPGFGFGWIPNVDAGWYPYSFGRWCWYPGFGYTWISADPWGWLPYHYGGWNFVPGVGWMWFPGSFGIWSPALVSWYAGPGWIGWMAQSGLPYSGTTNPCPQGQSCGTAVSINVFQRGRPLRPGTILAVNLASGKRIEQPNILPDRQAMLPGPVVPQPAGFANARPVLLGTGGAAITSQTITRVPVNPAPSAVAGPNHVGGGSAVGFAVQHVAPAPESGIVYDPAAGRYVNNSRLPFLATQAPNDLDIRPLPLTIYGGGVSTSQAGQPPSRTPQVVVPTAAPQSHPRGWFHGSSPQSAPGSSAAARSGGSASSGQAMGGSGSWAGGAASGASMAGASHSGASGSAGPHR